MLADSIFSLKYMYFPLLPKKVTPPIGQAVRIFHLPLMNIYS